MADKITTSRYMAVNFGFVDGDTRLAKIPNPSDEVTASEVSTVSSVLLTNKLIVGDKAGADFAGILTADSYDVTKTEFDL